MAVSREPSQAASGVRVREHGFRICDQKGFHVTFENGWTVSVQFGGGNYSQNYGHPIGRGEVPPSNTAEVALIAPDGSMPDIGGDTVRGWQSPAEVLALMVETAARPAADTSDGQSSPGRTAQ